MTPIPRYDDTIDEPLHTGEQILARVRDLIGPASRSQTWLLFLDGDDVQLPVIVPIDAVPEEQPLVDSARELLSALAAATDAAAVIVVIESPHSRELGGADRAWAIALREAASTEGVDVRALLLSHDDGVRALGPDDVL